MSSNDEDDRDEKKRRPERLILAIYGAQWLILPDALETIIEIAHRANTLDPEALLSRYPDRLQGTRSARNVDGVAVIPIYGPIVPRATLFSAISGATSTDVIAADFGNALRDPNVHGIVLDIDSPGGAASGVPDLGAMIHAARGQKPIKAYVAGTAASAAYWAAAATDEVITSVGGLLGSVGVVVQIQRGPKDVIEITSSQSPNKRPDAWTDAGRAEIQSIVDALGDVFVQAVAKYRGIGAADVIERFGRGGIRVGAHAVAAGMADRISTLEEVIASIGSPNTSRRPQAMTKLTAQQVAADHPEAADALRAEGFAKGREEGITIGRKDGRVEENARIKGIRGAAIPGHDALVEALIDDQSVSAGDAALRINAAEKKLRDDSLANMRTDAATVTKVAAAAAPENNASKMPPDDAPVEERCKAKWDSDPKVREEFRSLASFTAYTRAQEKGLTR